MPRGNGRRCRAHADDKAYRDDSDLDSVKSSISFESMKGFENLTCDESSRTIFQSLGRTMGGSSDSRISTLVCVNAVMIHSYVPEFIKDQKDILIDCIKKCIRRGKDVEKVWAARLGPLLLMQVGRDESIMKELYPMILDVIKDDTVLSITRSKFCTTLGLMVYLAGSDIDEIFPLMQEYENIFSGSYLPDAFDGATPDPVDDHLANLHAEALSSWSLMVTLLSQEDFVSTTTGEGPYTMPPVNRFLGLLNSPHILVRASACLAIALIIETGRRHNKDVFNESMTELIDTARRILRGSRKYCIKLIRTVNRSTFVDLLKYLKEDMVPNIKIKIGDDCLLLDTWYQNHRYTGLCSIAGPGMETHLKNNEYIRELFDIESIENSNDDSKANKVKARTIERNQDRDKRRVMMDIGD